MPETIRTKTFTIDRARYLKAMWTRGLPRALVVVVALYAAVLTFVGMTWGTPALMGGVPACLVVLVLSIGLRYLSNRRVVYGRSSAKVYDDGRTVEFSENGVHVLTQGGIESKVPWTQFEKAERRGPFMMLFFTKMQHFIIPDEAFAATSERESLERLLREKGLLNAT